MKKRLFKSLMPILLSIIPILLPLTFVRSAAAQGYYASYDPSLVSYCAIQFIQTGSFYSSQVCSIEISIPGFGDAVVQYLISLGCYYPFATFCSW